MAGFQGTKLPGFETEPCSRCGGSGRYSFCEMFADTCFKCGWSKAVPGSGRQLTKRGRAALDFYRASLPTKLPADLVVGDRFRPGANDPWWTVVAAPSDVHESGRSLDHKTQIWTPHYGVTVEAEITYKGGRIEKCRWGLLIDHRVPVRPNQEEVNRLLAEAHAYQETLTKQGTPRKVARKLQDSRV